MPITSLAVTQQKRQTHPYVQTAEKFNFSPMFQDKSTVYASTKGVYDSRKSKNEEMDKYEWKILTLR